MPLELQFDVLPDHARARVSGSGSIDEFLDVLRRISAVSSHVHPQVVLDLRQLHGLEKLTEQMTAGIEAAGLLGRLRRVAVLEPAFRVTHSGEKAARRLGLDLKVFTAEEEAQAVAWLNSDPDDTDRRSGSEAPGPR